MRTGTLFKRYELLVAAAVLASHANSLGQGFRQRDVRFLIELFANWLSAFLDPNEVKVGNVQVLRYLEALVAEGQAKKVSRKRPPSYRLTRAGLLQLLSRIVKLPAHIDLPLTIFAFYFVGNYKHKVRQMVAEEGAQFPDALRIEVEALLDVPTLLNAERVRVRREKSKIEGRIRDARNSSALAKVLARQGLSALEIASEIEAKYPYDLNNQKPLGELYRDIAPDLREWELDEGAIKRVEELWLPSITLLDAYLKVLTTFERGGE